MPDHPNADVGYSPRPTSPSSGRPPLRRDTDAGFLGGVAAGVANHLGVDVVLIRIGFVVVTVVTQGLGALAYLLLWAIIQPDDEDGQSAAASRRAGGSVEGRGSGFWVGVVLLTIGILWFLIGVQLPGVPFRFFDTSLVVPLLLIGLGVALWRGGGGPDGGRANVDRPAPPASTASSTSPVAPSGPPPPPPSSQITTSDAPDRATPAPEPAETPMDPTPTSTAAPSSAAVIDRPDETGGGYLPPPTPPPSAEADGGGFTPPPVPDARRSILTRLTLGLALLTAGVLWILEVTTALSLGPVNIVAIALAVIGAGLLLGSVLGRGRGLIIAGFLLIPIVLLGSLLTTFPAGQLLESTFRGEAAVGEIAERVEIGDDLSELYQLGAGSLVLDLGDLELTEDREVVIQMGVGELDIIVPDDVTVDVTANMAVGELRVLGQRRAGLGLSLSASEPPAVSDATAPTLFLEVEVGIGDVTVRRIAEPSF